MKVKTILNRCHPIRGFTYESVELGDDGQTIHVMIVPRKGSRPFCSGCGQRRATYDTAREARFFAFTPILGFRVWLCYCMRRVNCQDCGAKVELVPWADGKHQICNAYRVFLARWAKRLSWTEVARIFGTSWNVVFRSIQWVVAYGLARRNLDDVKAIGVDEIAVRKGHKYLTVVYQIDAGARRLLWVGKERTAETFRGFFGMLGKRRTAALRFIASDMWRPYLDVIAEMAGNAIHVLDRFHIVANLNKAIDQVRAEESRELRAQGYEPILKKTRWCFLKRKRNLTETQRGKLRDVLRYDLRTVRAYLLKESLQAFWTFIFPGAAGWYLDQWCARAMRSRIEPIKKFARSLRSHRDLILNWFRARGEISSAVVEGLNTNAKLALRKARGFRSHEISEIALFHQLGRLPEPTSAIHRFC